LVKGYFFILIFMVPFAVPNSHYW